MAVLNTAEHEAIPLRLDARRNRDKILLAARTAFLEMGATAPLEEIARRAEVGIATLYRRFPNRGVLIRQVVVDNEVELLAEARGALAAEARPWDALARFVRRVAFRRLGALVPVLGGQIDPDDEFRELRDELVGTMERLIAAAQADGDLRPGIGFGDIQMLITLLARFLPGSMPGPADGAIVRYVEVVLDGLRVRPDGSELPGFAMHHHDIEACFLSPA